VFGVPRASKLDKSETVKDYTLRLQRTENGKNKEN
jgi:hypothetical protein